MWYFYISNLLEEIVNNRTSVTLLIALLVGMGGIAYLYIEKPFNKDPLWDGKPKVVYDFQSYSWIDRWIVKEGPHDDAWRGSADRLNEVLKAHSSEIIDYNFCIKYVNDYNNTIFIVSKSLDDEVKQAFLDVMKPPEKVMVLFRKGPASFIELDEWENLIFEELDTLREKGAFVLSLSKTVNGTLKLTVEDLDKQKVKIILDVLNGKVPPGILVIFKGSRPELLG